LRTLDVQSVALDIEKAVDDLFGSKA